MKKVRCKLGERSYDVLIGNGVLGKLPLYLRKINRGGGKALIVTNRNIAEFYLERVIDAVPGEFDVSPFFVPDGEAAKSGKWLFKLYSFMLKNMFDRNSVVIALGGGVVGDLSGFLASTYMRGVSFVNIPTTLLAQVDSAIGGKTGINLPEGKNMVGTFYQPKVVLADISFLKTLSEKIIGDSFFEIIKYGIIYDEKLFSYLEKNLQKGVSLDDTIVTHLVYNSVKIKTAVVEADEEERSGLRAILNYGHTFAHAFEAVSSYGGITHGAAVGIGMIAAAYFSFLSGILKEGDFKRVERLIKNIDTYRPLGNIFGKDIKLDIFIKKVIKYMLNDKKNSGGDIVLILPDKIGHVIKKRVKAADKKLIDSVRFVW